MVIATASRCHLNETLLHALIAWFEGNEAALSGAVTPRDRDHILAINDALGTAIDLLEEWEQTHARMFNLRSLAPINSCSFHV